MAKRVALIPEELVSSYHLQKPELRLEDDIDTLLERAKLPDDMKAKLLGQLITRYHRTVHAPPEPIRVSLANEAKETKEEKGFQQVEDPVIRDIILSTPQKFSRLVPLVAEKLKSRLYSWNDRGEMILDAIDVFSKRGYAIPLKSKSADSVLEGFKKLFKETNFVVNLQTDEGKEFFNKKVRDYFRRHGIHHYASNSEYKASVVERFNRTLKSKLYRIFTYTNSYRYVHVLKSVLKSYNLSIHRSTGYAPADVKPELESEIFEKLYGYSIKPRYKFEVNDQVRISKTRRAFRKGYLPSWTDEVFVIYKRYPSSPPTYLLKDLKGTVLKGRFYEQELQKVLKSSHDFWRVEKILQTRGVGAKKEYFVKWKGFDRRFNSWVKASWMK
ncbi:uncharacterized protein LOC118185697 [Stegodyphus dumicola]|uniref:uncharacterized protein LOC118185697 n=1 Tax=Stegodyphus dumicola TaxID=202533 RepID=UPI0015AC0770|nr:uncharacterized protein LOC118185697 [Stegodyphus dumicola]